MIYERATPNKVVILYNDIYVYCIWTLDYFFINSESVIWLSKFCYAKFKILVYSVDDKVSIVFRLRDLSIMLEWADGVDEFIAFFMGHQANEVC